jgi:LytS/YehU family sensor histidine kinase
MPAKVAGAKLPPMLLLPLVDCAVVHGLRPAYEGGKLSIRDSVVDNRLQLKIVDTGAGFVADSDGSEIACIRERLAALYGERTSLRVSLVPSGGMEALMEMPYEPAV